MDLSDRQRDRAAGLRIVDVVRQQVAGDRRPTGADHRVVGGENHGAAAVLQRRPVPRGLGLTSVAALPPCPAARRTSSRMRWKCSSLSETPTNNRWRAREARRYGVLDRGSPHRARPTGRIAPSRVTSRIRHRTVCAHSSPRLARIPREHPEAQAPERERGMGGALAGR